MSDLSTAIAAITNMEAAAFRTGQVARRLLRDHPDLANLSFMALVGDGGFSDLEFSGDTSTREVLDACAAALGIALTSKLGRPYVRGGFESVKGLAEIDGTKVTLTGTYLLTPEEWEARHVVTAPAIETGVSA